jgi:hypothetical protein
METGYPAALNLTREFGRNLTTDLTNGHELALRQLLSFVMVVVKFLRGRPAPPRS